MPPPCISSINSSATSGEGRILAMSYRGERLALRSKRAQSQLVVNLESFATGRPMQNRIGMNRYSPSGK